VTRPRRISTTSAFESNLAGGAAACIPRARSPIDLLDGERATRLAKHPAERVPEVRAAHLSGSGGSGVHLTRQRLPAREAQVQAAQPVSALAEAVDQHRPAIDECLDLVVDGPQLGEQLGLDREDPRPDTPGRQSGAGLEVETVTRFRFVVQRHDPASLEGVKGVTRTRQQQRHVSEEMPEGPRCALPVGLGKLSAVFRR
jgi:hypothetical protein